VREFFLEFSNDGRTWAPLSDQRSEVEGKGKEEVSGRGLKLAGDDGVSAAAGADGGGGSGGEEESAGGGGGGGSGLQTASVVGTQRNEKSTSAAPKNKKKKKKQGGKQVPFLLLPGNSDSRSVQCVRFSRPLKCRFLRFVATKWTTNVALRVEVFGPQRYTFVGGGLEEGERAAQAATTPEAAAAVQSSGAWSAAASSASNGFVVAGDTFAFRFRMQAKELKAKAVEEKGKGKAALALSEGGAELPLQDMKGAATAPVASDAPLSGTSTFEALAPPPPSSSNTTNPTPTTSSSPSQASEVDDTTAVTTAATRRKRRRRKHYRFVVTAVGMPFEETRWWLSGFGADLARVNGEMGSWSAAEDQELLSLVHAKVEQQHQAAAAAAAALRGLGSGSGGSELTATEQQRQQVSALSLPPSALSALSPKERMQLQRLAAKPSWVAEPKCLRAALGLGSEACGGSGGGGLPVVFLHGVVGGSDEGEGAAAAAASKGGGSAGDDGRGGAGMVRVDVRQIRFAFLQGLNERLRRILPFLDLSTGLEYRTGHKLRRLG